MRNLLTPRLVIRPFDATDIADYLAYQTRPEVRAYLPDKAMTEAEALTFFTRQAAMQDDDRDCYHSFAVFHVEDAKVIGDVGFYRAAGPENKADLGFQFHPDYQGKGYANEAAAALIRHGFLNWELQRITSGCDARNIDSWRLMERLGMRREAQFRQSRITRGVLHDEYTYALLREEWLAQQ